MSIVSTYIEHIKINCAPFFEKRRLRRCRSGTVASVDRWCAVRRYHSVCPAQQNASVLRRILISVCGPTFAVCYGDDSSGWFFGFARRCVCYLEGFGLLVVFI